MEGRPPLPRRTEEIARSTINAAFAVHKALGPGLLESVYEHCLADEIEFQGLRVQRQLPLPVIYRERRIEAGYRLDLLVEGAVIVEVKAVEALAPVHTAQLLTYLRLADLRLGLLINFDVALLKEGLRRVVL